MATTGRCNFKYSLCISGPWLLEQVTMKSVVKHLRLGMYNLITQEVLSPKLASLPGLTQGINCSKNTRKKSVSLFLKPLFFIPSSMGSVLPVRCTSPHATVTLPPAPMLTSFSSLPPSLTQLSKTLVLAYSSAGNTQILSHTYRVLCAI